MSSYDVSLIYGLYGAFIVSAIIIALGVYALMAWILGRIFRKAGIEVWKAWVPIYNQWVFLELGRQPGWLAVLVVVPGLNIITAVFAAIAAYKISIGFGKEGAWVVLYILVPIVWYLILAFDSSWWQPWRIPTAEAPYGYAPPPGVTPPPGSSWPGSGPY